MKRTGILALTMLLLLAAMLTAAEYRGGQVVRIETGDTLSSDLFSASRYLDVDGVVLGDVYATAERVTVKGDVKDDVLTFGRSLSIQGKVGDQVLFMGESLVVDGEVYGDILAFGGNVELTNNAIVHGDVMVGTGNLNINGGRIDGNVTGGAGTVYLNGVIGKKVVIRAKNVSFGPDYLASQGTRLTLRAPLDSAKVGNIPANLQIVIKKPKQFYQRTYFYWSMVAMFIVGVLLIVFAKNFVRDYITASLRNPLKSTGIGFLILVAVPVAIIILLVLILTIPVGLIFLALYIILLYLSYVFTALTLGDYFLGLMRKESSPAPLVGSLLLGVVLVALLPKIPVIGWVLKLAIICFGLGSLLFYLWQLKSANKVSTA